VVLSIFYIIFSFIILASLIYLAIKCKWWHKYQANLYLIKNSQASLKPNSSSPVLANIFNFIFIQLFLSVTIGGYISLGVLLINSVNGSLLVLLGFTIFIFTNIYIFLTILNLYLAYLKNRMYQDSLEQNSFLN